MLEVYFMPFIGEGVTMAGGLFAVFHWAVGSVKKENSNINENIYKYS